jgi:hypothetical protein
VPLGDLGHAEELDAVFGAFQQGQHLAQLGNGFGGARQGLVGELDHQVALRHAALGHVHADPVVRQARAGEHQLAGLERADPVAHEHLAAGAGDQVQLVFVVVVPARQRRREAVGQAAHETHVGGQFVAQVGRADELVFQLGLELARGGGHLHGHGGLRRRGR